MRVLSDRTDPLIVINGIPDTSLRMASIDKNIIETIDSLKSASATAIYGPDGANGAIIITTKNSKFEKIIIKDSLNDSPMAGATVSFISLTDKNNKFQFVADDSGVVSTNKLNRSVKYEMTVSAVGHTTWEQVFENGYNYKENEILLGREIRTCDEVVLTYTQCILKRKHILSWTCGRMDNITNTNVDRKIYTELPQFKVYPDPVQKGSSINLQFNSNNQQEKTVRLISLDGRILLQQSFTTSRGKNLFQLPTDARWSAGIYFVQLLYENGKVAASEKVIIQ